METKTFLTPEETLHNADSVHNQNIKQKFVGREVYCNVNTMVEFILSQSYENNQVPFTWDDLENYYEYPEYIGEFADFPGGTEEYLDAEVERLKELLQEKISLYDELAEIKTRTRKQGNEYAKLEKEIGLIEDEMKKLEELESEPQEIFEWWAVSDYLFDKLKDHGYPVVDAGSCYVWGRCTTGQAILLDGVISSICADMEILEGQRNEWKL